MQASDSADSLHDLIFRDILELRGRFPPLLNLKAEHFQGHYVQYENGRREVPNDNYEIEHQAYIKEMRQREEEEVRGPKRKLRMLEPPSRTRTSWDEAEGISLWLSLNKASELDTCGMRAAVEIPVPHYEAIRLRTTGGSEYEARVGPFDVHIQVEGGGSVGAVREAIFDILMRRHMEATNG